MNIKTSTKEEKQEANKKTYSHIASKLWKNRSEFAFLTVCRYDIYNIIFVFKMLHIFPIERIVQNKFQITVHIGIHNSEVSIIFDGFICFFLAAQFGIWIKNKRGLELVTSCSSSYKTSSENYLYYLYMTTFGDVI